MYEVKYVFVRPHFNLQINIWVNIGMEDQWKIYEDQWEIYREKQKKKDWKKGYADNNKHKNINKSIK